MALRGAVIIVYASGLVGCAAANPQVADERVIAEGLRECGLAQSGFIIRSNDELQSIEIVIDATAGASKDKLDCIRQASAHEIVTFRDQAMQDAYHERAAEALQPKILAEAREGLEKRGLLKGFPERSAYSSDKLFAEALERHCGMKPGSFLVMSHGQLTAQPKRGELSTEDWDKSACMMNAIMYVSAKGGNFKIGFIGNEAVAPEN